MPTMVTRAVSVQMKPPSWRGLRPERGDDRERAAAFGDPEPEQEAGRGGDQHERVGELDPGEACELDARQAARR